MFAVQSFGHPSGTTSFPLVGSQLLRNGDRIASGVAGGWRALQSIRKVENRTSMRAGSILKVELLVHRGVLISWTLSKRRESGRTQGEGESAIMYVPVYRPCSVFDHR